MLEKGMRFATKVCAWAVVFICCLYVYNAVLDALARRIAGGY
jgi:hypothetical protein